MSPPSESSLLARLEASDYTDLPAQISAFLQPFRPFLADEPEPPAGKKKKRAESKSKQQSDDTKLLRPLAKQFLPFLSRLLKLLPARLSEECPSKVSAARASDETADELFGVYRLALDCIACISPCIAAKPYMKHLLRVRLVRCLEAWGRYEEAEREGFGLLESLKSLVLQKPSRAQKGKKSEVSCYLPAPDSENSDPELAFSVAETVVCLVSCVYKSESKNGGDYRRVLALVEQVEPWLSVLDTKECEKFRGALVSALYKCALVMLVDSKVFYRDLAHQFCLTTLKECLRSQIKDQFPKMARKVCSSLEWENGHSFFLDILGFSLELLVCKCKANLPSFADEVLDFLHDFSCICKCHDSSGQLSERAAERLRSFEVGSSGITPLSIILSAYAAGLYYVDVKIRELLQRLSEYDPLSNFFCDGVVIICSQKGSRACKNIHGGISLFSYIRAIDFLCDPLSDSINTTWKHVIMGQEEVPFYPDINYVQDVFHHFCETFLTGIKNACEKGRERLRKNRATLLHVSMAAFRVFLHTDRSCQKSMGSIDSIISSNWIEPQELRYLATHLYNIGVSLYNSKDFEKASLSLDLCCRAMWTHVSNQCSQFSQGVDRVKMNISEESINDSVSDACSKTAIFLDVLYECRIPDMNKVIVNSLIHWSRARELLNVVGPNVLVRQWVKIMCKVGTNVNVGDQPQSLCYLIPSVWEKATRGIILDQELSAYTEMEGRNPDLCVKMQLEIIEILLQDVYITKNCSLEKSTLLVKKGRLLRAAGIDGVKNCSECLSEAISILKDASNRSSKEAALMYHHLALTYCLHALCTQEIDQNLEVILDDVSCAITSWSSINMENILSSDEDFALEFKKALPLLYHVADLLSLKGLLDHHFEIYKLIITIGKRNNVSLEKNLAMLWDDRRLNHALCTSPIDGDLLLELSERFGSQVKSVNFWIDCTDGQHPSSLLGFLQNFMSDNLRVANVDLTHLKKSPPVDISISKIKEAACALLSSVPKISQQTLLAGHLYYDLSERLISSGQLYEALSAAREALCIRTKLLQKKFTYFIGNDVPDMTKTVETKTVVNQNFIHLEVINSTATEFWPDVPKLRYSGDFVHSPWNVLKCYLESCFQVGIIHELTGNGVDAEALLLMGKNLSCLQGLPLLTVAFGSKLGRIYCKKHKWDLAEVALDECKQVLNDCNRITSCSQCKLALKSTLDFQFGDLIRTRSYFAPQINPSEGLPSAVNFYSVALERLNISEPDYLVSNKSNNAKTSSRHVPEKHALKTRCSKVTLADRNHGNGEQDLMKSSAGTKLDAKKEISMLDVISLKWECHQRRLAINLLIKIGKSAISFWEIHEVHKKLCLCVSLLFRGYIFSRNFDMSDFLLLMGEEIPNDVYVMERATLLYEISWVSLKKCAWRQSSKVCCCDLSNIQMPQVICWLLRAFIISRELPVLFQKISRLLATLILLSTATDQPLLPENPCGKFLSSSHWGAFFHQASIGAYLHQQYYSVLRGKYSSYSSLTFEGLPSAATSSSEALSVRFLPEKLEDLQQFVQNFFISLPCVTIICMSMLGGGYVDLIMEMLHLPSSFPALLLVTRFNSQKEPVIMLLPADSVIEEIPPNDAFHCAEPFTMDSEKSKKWLCPWGHTLIDNVVPQFKSILEENYSSSSNPSPVDTKESRILWWTRRTRLNDRLNRLLDNIEDSWFGPWRCLFLGDRLDSGYLDRVLANLMGVLRNEYGFDAREHLLKTILSGDLSLPQREECVSQLFLYRGYFGRGGSCGEKRCGLFSSFCVGVEDECGSLRQLILEAISEVEEEVTNREPVVLVMDADIQMLPWESLPALRQQEVYRMPSFGSIHVALNQPKASGTKALGFYDIFPSVDPSDAYYLLNPSGDLSNTQLEFEEWFKSQNWEGRAGNVPSAGELTAALQSRDLFIYFGHGSGIQYLPGHEIQKLERCAATLLMGCSSGCLSLNGIYAPFGAPISYLLAGSPAIVSNLWDVTDKDIDRFGKVMVDAWLQEASKPVTVCDRCNHIVKEFESLTIGNKRNCSVPRTSRKAVKGKKLQEKSENCKCKNNYRKVRLASFMGQARDACRFPFLIGASPVCYGVPTVIRKKGS